MAKLALTQLRALLVLSGATVLAWGSVVFSEDWPQFRGSNFDGISLEKETVSWPASGPKVVWKVPTQAGFSSFAVADGHVFTLVDRKEHEGCVALDAKTGKELWYQPVGNAKYDHGAGEGDGPRSTPSVDDGHVYIFNKDFVLHCLDAKKGKPVWKKDLGKEYDGQKLHWNNASSPLVEGDNVYVAGGGPGKTLLAFNKKTGKLAWKGEDEKITHSTPIAATMHGVRQVIFYLQSGLVSVTPDEGKVLWRFPFDYSTSTAISPIVSGDMVYCSAGYGVGAGACKVSYEGGQFKAVELWRIKGNKPIANHWSTPVCKDGYLYGLFSFKQLGRGPLKCVELATGKVMWEEAGFGQGNVILVNDKLLVIADDGRLVMVDATPEAYKEVGQIQAVKGKAWTTPAFSNGRVYVRSAEEGACLDLTVSAK